MGKGIAGVVAASLVYIVGAVISLLGIPFLLTAGINIPVISTIIKVVNVQQQGALSSTLITLATLLFAVISTTVLESMATKKAEYYICYIINILISILLGAFMVYVYIENVVEKTNIIDILDFLCFVGPYIIVSGYFIYSIRKHSV